MSTVSKTLSGIVLLLIVAGVAWFVYAGMRGNTDDVSIRATVTNFGQQQQKVSLLSPDASQQIAKVYAPYVAQDLLTAWEKDPTTAPGRQTSSPWPDHIDISTATKAGGVYTVTGSVVLMTSDEVAHGGNAGTIPVTLTLEKQNSTWLITHYTQGEPQAAMPATGTTATPQQKTYTHQNPAFSFMYASAFTLTEGAPSGQDKTYWSELADPTMPGNTYVTLSLARSLQPNTNFSDARFTVGRSTDAQAIAKCLTVSNGNPAASSKITINGTPFTVTTTSDAGAGNVYSTTSYRTVRDGACYAIEYTVHTTNLANYPAGAVHAYDESALKGLLDGVVNSFAFGTATSAQ